MQIAVTLVAIAVAVITFSGLASRLGFSAPLLLLVVGIVGSFLPFASDIRLTPDLVLLGMLPPILYSAAIRTSVIDIRANVRAIGLMSIALVAISAIAVGLVAWLVLSIPFAAAFSLGAVVAPPDAVAATSIARRMNLPRKVITILEGESLLNDATAITCLRVGILAMAAGSIGPLHVVGAFLVAGVGGAAVGTLVALLVILVRRRVSDPILDTAISLVVPFAANLPAEALHIGHDEGSGIIAVVTAGLILGHKSPTIQSAQSRLGERTNWSTISFLLENSVFLLIGLQTRNVVIAAVDDPIGLDTIVLLTLAVVGTLIAVRLVWVFAQRFVLFRREGDNVVRPPWQPSLLIGWAGMRGVVTLAVAFLLPPETPQRGALIFCALGVTAVTLLAQGTTLPILARSLGMHGPGARQDALQTADVLQAASRAGLARLAEVRRDTDSKEVVDRLHRQLVGWPNAIWERLGTSNEVDTPAEEYRRLRMSTLRAERDELLRIRDHGSVPSEVIGRVLYALDVEESMLTAIDTSTQRVREENLEVPAGLRKGCEHLDQAPHDIEPDGPGNCQDCEREGTRPVHLRICLTCGNVGCCDSSVGQHAARHFEASAHPVMRSFEPGEDWRWCYEDQRVG